MKKYPFPVRGFLLNGDVPCMEWLTTYQIGTNKLTLKSDHYEPCLNILCAKYNNKHKLY